MDHATHTAGTIPECQECEEAAYEPGWYAMLQRLSERPDDEEMISIPAATVAVATPVPVEMPSIPAPPVSVSA